MPKPPARAGGFFHGPDLRGYCEILRASSIWYSK